MKKWRSRGWVTIRSRLLHEKYSLQSRCRGKKVKQPFGKKNACDEAEGLESAKKC